LETVHTVAALRGLLARARREGKEVGLVPTMGALHRGHLSLVALARRGDDVVVASIFVNPAQFGPNEDLTRYPRTRAEDVALLQGAGVDVLFMPSVAEVYPRGFATRVEVGPIGTVLEGKTRPGHFGGVATVVTKLFNMGGPDRAYFGQKDAQQIAVIKQMVRDLDLPVSIVAGPTVREDDGLALSSRNRFLSARERTAATVLSRALQAGRQEAEERGATSEKVRLAMHDVVMAEPLARLDYATVVDAATMDPLDEPRPDALLVIAVVVGSTRLIDNMVLGGV